MKKNNNTSYEKPYLKQSVFKLWTARAPWLILLMLSNTFTSMILSGYEKSLSALSNGTVLYAFIPMLMGTAGNAGGQASVTVIRALAIDEIRLKDALKIIAKEFGVALFIGFSVCVVCFLKLYFIDSLYSDGITKRVALIVSGVLFITIVLAKMVGCTLPLLAQKLKLDPAVVASPFMTTVVDVISLMVYCSICVLLL